MFTAALSTERPTQLHHGILWFCKVASIFWKISSAVPDLVPLVVHISRNRCATLVTSNTRTVRGLIFSLPALTKKLAHYLRENQINVYLILKKYG